MSAAEVLRQAEELKAAVSDTSRCANEVWVSRQALQDIYQKLLVLDLEFALDKKVEQDLWNHAFKKQISTLQSQAKEKQNQKRGEVQSSLNLFLETASGFYLQLLQVICSAFRLDLPFRKKSSNYGIMREYGPVMSKIRTPKRSSCLYICQDCLVHLGDIARYRQQIDQAQVYYRHAAHLVPYNGQPYNQLAILEAAKGNRLSTVFFHIRSIAVKHPFPVAMTNLEKFYAKISKDSHEYRPKLTANELIGVFLQLHALIHLCIDLTKAKSHIDRMLLNLPTHIASNSFSSYQLVQMVAINLFSLYYSKRKLNYSGQGSDGKSGNDKNGNQDPATVAAAAISGKSSKAGAEGKTTFGLLFETTLSMFEVLLQSTPKDELKAKSCHTLAPIKVLLDWLHTDSDSLSNPSFKTSLVWMNLSELLNSLQFSINQSDTVIDLQTRMSTPLPEDCDLECFLPVSKAHSDLTYYSMSSDTMTEEIEMKLRCQKLIASGYWIAEEFPSLNLLNVQRLANGRLEFNTQVRPVQGSNGDHKAPRQNVAIQAIMQKGNMDMVDKKRDGISNQLPRQLSSKTAVTETKQDQPEKLDAGVMAHMLHGVGDNDHCSDTSFGSWSSAERQFCNSQGSAGSPGSCQSVSTEMSYTHKQQQRHQVSLPSNAVNHSQQQMYPYFVPQQSIAPMYVRPPSNDAPMLQQIQSQHQSTGMIGPPRVMNHVEQPNQQQQNGPRFSGSGKDGLTGHLDQLAAYYGQGIRGFVPQDQMAPQLPPQNQTFFRIGQPFSYGGAITPPPRNIMSMYMTRPEDAVNRGLPLAMGMMPPQQLPWQRQPLIPPRMPFVQYPSLSEPPPKLSQSLPDNYSGGAQLGYHQGLPATSLGLPPDPSIIGGMNSLGHQSGPVTDHDNFLFTPGFSGRFPASSSHLQSGLINGVECMTFPNLDFSESNPVLDQPQLYTDQQRGHGSVYGMRNGAQMTDMLDMQNPVSASQPTGLFQVEKRIMDDLEMIQKSPDHKANNEPMLSYSTSTGMGKNFSCRPGDVLKPDSPQPIGTRQGSMFTSAGNVRKEQQPTSNTYSLFSQSPWPVGIAKSADGNSHASSTFGSSNSSLPTTPDPDERSSVSSGGGYRVGLFSRSSTGNEGPWNTPSLGTTNPLTASTLATGGSLLNNSLQSLWNSGPSPLEKLLEQQKQQQQRQSEPR